MSNRFKDIDIKNQTYYFFMMLSTNIDLNKIKIDEMSYRNIFIYYIGYVTIKRSKI